MSLVTQGNESPTLHTKDAMGPERSQESRGARTTRATTIATTAATNAVFSGQSAYSTLRPMARSLRMLQRSATAGGGTVTSVAKCKPSLSIESESCVPGVNCACHGWAFDDRRNWLAVPCYTCCGHAQ